MELRRLKNASLFFGPETFRSHPLFSFHQVVSEALVVEDAAAAVETDFSAVLTLEGKWKMIHFENGQQQTFSLLLLQLMPKWWSQMTKTNRDIKMILV